MKAKVLFLWALLLTPALCSAAGQVPQWVYDAGIDPNTENMSLSAPDQNPVSVTITDIFTDQTYTSVAADLQNDYSNIAAKWDNLIANYKLEEKLNSGAQVAEIGIEFDDVSATTAATTAGELRALLVRLAILGTPLDSGEVRYLKADNLHELEITRADGTRERVIKEHDIRKAISDNQVAPKPLSVGETLYNWVHLDSAEEPRTWTLYKLLGYGDGTRRPRDIPTPEEVTQKAQSLTTPLAPAAMRLLTDPTFLIAYHAAGDATVFAEYPDRPINNADTYVRDKDVARAFYYLGNRMQHFSKSESQRISHDTIRTTTQSYPAMRPLALMEQGYLAFFGRRHSPQSLLSEKVFAHRSTPYLILACAALTGGLTAAIIWEQKARARHKRFVELYNSIETSARGTTLTPELVKRSLELLHLQESPAMLEAWLSLNDDLNFLRNNYTKWSDGRLEFHISSLPKERQERIKKALKVIHREIKDRKNEKE